MTSTPSVRLGLRQRLRAALPRWARPLGRVPAPAKQGGDRALRGRLSSVTVRVDDHTAPTGWTESSRTGSNERDTSEMQELYADALTAWRKNPLAKRIVDVISDFCLGDGLTPAAPGQMGRFLHRWWTHDKNRMDLRLVEFSDELARAGDLFVTLHRNPADGISYVRAIPRDHIVAIETLPDDWETEIAYTETRGSGVSPEDRITWLAPRHPQAYQADAIMIHYKVNPVVGAQFGESDLATMLPWLLRYSRMLEDRVRLNWALKAFLWMVTVPTNLVASKRDQYAVPPEGGSIIVKDSQETWEPVTPSLHAFDARYDMHAVRQMIDAGAGIPPHWRGEATDVNLATATAMERSATRHLRRRQLYLRYLVTDLSHVAYCRAYEIGRVRAVPRREAIQVDTPDLNRQDNKDLADAAQALSSAVQTLTGSLATPTAPALQRRVIDLVFRFAGEPLDPKDLDAIMDELASCVGAGLPTEPPAGLPPTAGAGLPWPVGQDRQTEPPAGPNTPPVNPVNPVQNVNPAQKGSPDALEM